MENDPRDAGLEAFLHLLNPKLSLPQISVEPQEIKLRLDKGEEKETSLHIRNQGRGYLSGSIELSEQLPGLELSAYRFGLDSKAGNTDQDIIVNLRANSKELESGRKYHIFFDNKYQRYD